MTEQPEQTWNGIWAKKQADRCKSYHNKGQKTQVLSGIEAGRVAEDVFNTLGKGGYKKWREEYLSEVGDRTPRYWRKAWTGCDKLNLDPATVAASGFGLVAFGKWAADQIEKGVKSVTEAELSAAVAQKKTRSKPVPLDKAKRAIGAVPEDDLTALWNWIIEQYPVRVTSIEVEAEDAEAA
jgi:hypothetical protein